MADYTTLVEFKAATNKATADDDAPLAIIITAASRAIDRYCNRPDGFVALAVATARYYVGSGLGYQFIDDCVSITALAVKDSASDDESDYVAWAMGAIGVTDDADAFPATGDPEYPDYNRTPYTFLIVGSNGEYISFTSGLFTGTPGFRSEVLTRRGVPTVKVTAKWGYAITVPYEIKQACIMQSARWYKRIQGGMADALTSADLGTMIYTNEIDPDIAMVLKRGRYIKPPTGRR